MEEKQLQERLQLENMLDQVRRVLQVLLEQKAGYGSQVPAHLEIQLVETQKEVEKLETDLWALKLGEPIDRSTLRKQLEMSRVVLRVLEEKGAAYTSLTIPAHLKIELDDKRQEIVSLEDRLKTLEAVDKHTSPTSFNIIKLELTDIRCFKNFQLNLKDKGNNPIPLITFLGDNSVGKSTLVRSLALGLCSESDAATLTPGNFIRKGCSEGRIFIQLQQQDNVNQDYSIETTISLDSSNSEVIRKKTDPNTFPWSEIFVCGYGTFRTNIAKAVYDNYSTLNAVCSLFDDDATLQNPELALLRRNPSLRRIIELKLQQILLLDEQERTFDFKRTGLELKGPWGQQTYKTLSDGYRSTSQWVVDFLNWAIFTDRLPSNDNRIGGILLIDELEQHLHPRWQRYIIQRLQAQFPGTQIFTTTHAPLIASSVADCDEGLLVKLEKQVDASVAPFIIDKESIRGKRADQILASEAFDLITSRSPGSVTARDRFAELLGTNKRTEEEESELEHLRRKFEEKYTLEDRFAAQLVEQVIDEALDRALDTPPELIEMEAKRQVKELFDPDSNDEED